MLYESSPPETTLTVYRRPQVMHTEIKRAPTRANIFMAMDLLFCHVLRIEPSELDKGQDVTGLGVKE